jgi:hypothetical protein
MDHGKCLERKSMKASKTMKAQKAWKSLIGLGSEQKASE